jgi:transcription initiation factor IIE alpha subunit
MSETYCLMYGHWNGIDCVKRGLSKERAEKLVRKLEKIVEGVIWAITESNYRASLEAELLLKQRDRARKCPYCGREMER